ncbi:LysR family transcriptional regulator [Kiloniella sp. b19]|uniref:LysR family transcriptional regulator n=1 Tax=Kiloniella sp. GXU_MW_B19 TaxID=3141326 RepID=UPI0031D781A6
MAFRRIPSLNWLRVFETAALTESFAQAARLLNMSPPAVSQQIKALEQSLGKDLFIRKAQRVLLTDEGRAFLPVVRQSLSSIEATASALFGPEEREVLVIKVLFLMGCSWMAEKAARFEEEYPRIKLQLLTGNIPEDFARSGPDLQIAFGSATDFPEQAEQLFRERLIPVALPEIARNIKSVEDFFSYRLIEVSEHHSSWMQLLSDRLESDFYGTLSFTDNTVTALSLAGAGFGVALARAPISDRLVALNGLVPCLPGLDVLGRQHYYLFAPQGPVIKSAALVFRDWFLREIQKEGL